MQWEQVLEENCPTDKGRTNCEERFKIWVCLLEKLGFFLGFSSGEEETEGGGIIKEFENKWIVIKLIIVILMYIY